MLSSPHCRPLRWVSLLPALFLGLGCRSFDVAGDGFTVPVSRVERSRSDTPLELPAAGTVRVLVDLSVQVDLEELGSKLADRGDSRSQRRRAVVVALRQVAEASQKRLRPRLERLEARGWVSSWRGYSVVNRLLVEASPEGIRALRQWPEVAAVALETRLDPPPDQATAVSSSGEVSARGGRRSWAIDAVGAPVAWEQGLNGEGVVVGIIDSGASKVHEQLAENYRGGDASWYDPAHGNEGPTDRGLGHGTGVLSTAVGRNVAGVVLGVAPAARWVACAGLPESRYHNVLLTECAEWMLHTGRPDVLINAWLLPEAGCDPSLRRLVDAWRAAEIVPIFAAGNYGPGNDRSPANYGGLYPGGAACLSVGALSEDGEIFEESSTGPSSCSGEVFPRLVAPGQGVLTALPLTRSTYLTAKGTSQAAGFVAGAAAVLLQSDPEASVAEIETALTRGAVDLGEPGPDSIFGYGRLDLPGALEALRRRSETIAPASSSTETARQR